MGVPAAIVGAGAIAAVGSVAGSTVAGNAAEAGAKTQAAAQQSAAQMQLNMFNQNAANEAPYVQTGTNVLPALAAFPTQSQNALNTSQAAAQAAIPGTLTQQNLMNQPGYQFAVQQGNEAISNMYGGAGMANSGQAAKAISNFNTGLAAQNYQNLFAMNQTQYSDAAQQMTNQLANQTLQYNQLQSQANMGQAAASQVAVQGNAAAATAGQNIAGAGASLNAGTVSAGNALGSSLGSVGNTGANSLIYALAGGNNSLGTANATSNANSEYSYLNNGGQPFASTFTDAP